MKLSFVIPAWNEEKLIGKTIEAIQQSSSKYDFEIIVADDASTDRTAEIARELGSRVLKCNNMQIGPTRNDGASVATGEILIFVDADTIVSEAVVRETVEAIKNGAIAGGSFPTFDGKIPMLAKVLTPTLRVAFKILRVAAGAYMFCTLESFEKAGKFDSKFF